MGKGLRLNEWWLFGTTNTANWVTKSDQLLSTTMVDIANQYVAEGVNGGALKLALFILIIMSCFKGLGRALRDNPAISGAGFFVWAIGVSLFAHCFSFLSVSYFDQIIVAWFWLLASISCLLGIHSLRTVSVPLARKQSWAPVSTPSPYAEIPK